jgi:hypothetical protein
MEREKVSEADKRSMAWGVVAIVVIFHVLLLLGPGWFQAAYGGV